MKYFSFHETDSTVLQNWSKVLVSAGNDSDFQTSRIDERYNLFKLHFIRETLEKTNHLRNKTESHINQPMS